MVASSLLKIANWVFSLRDSLALLGIILSMSLVMTVTSFAHGGRTDSNGGHKDNKNVSGLGYYHYHCGGHPAHLHTNGCPYTNTTKPTTATSGESNTKEPSAQEIKQAEEEKRKAQEAKVKKEKEETNKKG